MTSNLYLRQQIQAAVEKLDEAHKKYPECRTDLAVGYLARNEIRPYPVAVLEPSFYSIPEGLEEIRKKKPMDLSVEERLLEALLSASIPVEMLNPIGCTIFTGRGPGTLAASFGIPLDPEAGYTPKGSRSIEDVLEEGMPDPENSGIIPEIREQIEAALTLTPNWIEIAPPDTQGPYNIAHMVLGEEAFILPLLEPDMFNQFMTITTDFYIAFYNNLRKWIGEERYPKNVNSRCRLRECSCNLISEKMYLDHVLPHDLRIVDYFGEVAIHPCSGRHVFYETMRNLPNIVYAEAMPYENSIAPSISIEEAIVEIGSKPMMLNTSRTLSKDQARDIIKKDFEMAREHPGLMYYYTINGVTRNDKEELIELHRWMNDYWHEHIWGRK